MSSGFVTFPRPYFRALNHPRREALAFERSASYAAYRRGGSNNFWTKVGFGTVLTPRSVAAARVVA